MGIYYDKFKEMVREQRAFAKDNESLAAFQSLLQVTHSEGGRLSLKTKELISIAVAVARQCEPCILSHIKLAVDLGVSREEVIEALNEDLLFCGGPGWSYAAIALAAYDDFAAVKAQRQAGE